MEPIRLISNNTYQIPWIIVQYYAHFVKDVPVDECRDQKIRAERLAKLLPEYDICILQEMWGSQIDKITKSLSDYHKPSRLNDFVWGGIYGWGADYWNLSRTFLRQNGGLYFASGPDLPIIWYKHHTFENKFGETLTNKSLGITLLNMDKKWKGKYLLVLNVHYHSPNPFGDTEARHYQRVETLEVLRSLQTHLFPIGFEWKNCGVIFAGDFNISQKQSSGENTTEYTKLINMFGPENKPMRNLREEMGGAGYPELNTFSLLNSYIPEKIWDECSTIDYIFALDHLPIGGGYYIGYDYYSDDAYGETYVETMRLKATKVEVLQQSPHQECSDHYPLTATIIPD